MNHKSHKLSIVYGMLTLLLLRCQLSKAQVCKNIEKAILTLSGWYLFESSCGALSDGYQYARGSVNFFSS